MRKHIKYYTTVVTSMTTPVLMFYALLPDDTVMCCVEGGGWILWDKVPEDALPHPTRLTINTVGRPTI